MYYVYDNPTYMVANKIDLYLVSCILTRDRESSTSSTEKLHTELDVESKHNNTLCDCA